MLAHELEEHYDDDGYWEGIATTRELAEKQLWWLLSQPAVQNQAALEDVFPFESTIFNQIDRNWVFTMTGSSWAGSKRTIKFDYQSYYIGPLKTHEPERGENIIYEDELDAELEELGVFYEKDWSKVPH